MPSFVLKLRVLSVSACPELSENKLKQRLFLEMLAESGIFLSFFFFFASIFIFSRPTSLFMPVSPCTVRVTDDNSHAKCGPLAYNQIAQLTDLMNAA